MCIFDPYVMVGDSGLLIIGWNKKVVKERGILMKLFDSHRESKAALLRHTSSLEMKYNVPGTESSSTRLV